MDMENNNYLNEEKYQKNNAKVKKIGKGILSIGIVSLVLGGISFFVGLFGDTLFIGLGTVLLAVGINFILISIIPFVIANRREIIAYRTQQVMPIAKGSIEQMSPTLGVAAEQIAKGVKKGLSDSERED